MRNFFIGMLIGIGKILPGVSGSIIAIRFDVYEKIINSMINFFKNIKKNTIFLLQIFLGVIISIVLMSNVFLYFYQNYKSITTILFALLILSGFKDIYSRGHIIIYTLLGVILPFSILLIHNINIGYFLMGIIESISIIIPGVSGTAIYISLGVYEKMLNLFIHFNINHLILFFLGFFLNSIFLVKIIDICFKRYKKETYSIILGFLISSIILMFT